MQTYAEWVEQNPNAEAEIDKINQHCSSVFNADGLDDWQCAHIARYEQANIDFNEACERAKAEPTPDNIEAVRQAGFIMAGAYKTYCAMPMPNEDCREIAHGAMS